MRRASRGVIVLCVCACAACSALAGEGEWCVNWDAASGAPRMLYGGKTQQYAGDPASAARQFLEDYADLFALPKPAAPAGSGRTASEHPRTGNLRFLRETPTPAATRITFGQFHRGIPVFGASVDIFIDRAGCAVHAASRLHPTVDVDIANADLTGGNTWLRNPADGPAAPAVTREPEIVIFCDDQFPDGRLAYRVFCTIGHPWNSWQYVIDGATGAILHRLHLATDAARPSEAGTGRVFDPNPVNKLNDPTLRFNSLIPPAGYDDVTLTDLDPPQDGLYRLSGAYVAMQDIETPANTPPISPDAQFRFNRGNSAFEDVMCYYHITQAQRYVQSLGFTNANNRRTQVDAHGLDRQRQAHYVVIGDEQLGFGYIAFGGGVSWIVDMAEDADVIIHEYGHAVQDNQQPGRYFESGTAGFGNETGAMAEGFSDYFAASCTYDASVRNGFDPSLMAEWAFPPSLRQMNNSAHYPESMADDIHYDSSIWSGTLWQIMNSLGRTVTDRIVLQSHFLVPPAPLFKDGADALLAADTMLYGDAHAAAISHVFLVRGIFQADLTDPGDQYASFSPANILLGQTLSVQRRVTNTSANVAVGPFVVRFYISRDTVLSADDLPLGEQVIATIGVNESLTCNWSGPLPAGTPAGSYYVGWSIDADGDVPEMQETNNVYWKTSVKLIVQWPPILDVSPPSLDFGQVIVGQAKELSFTLRNIGTGTVTGSAGALSAPFSCTAPTAYSLTGTQTKQITVRFAPASTGPFSATATFTGAAGAACPITGTGYRPKLAMPVITPEPAQYPCKIVVSMASDTPNVIIRYTTNGTPPTGASRHYSGPITLFTAATVRAKATLTGYLDSDVASASFDVQPGRLILEGPAERREGPLFSGGGTVRIDIYGENLIGFSGIQAALQCTDSLGRVTPLIISRQAGNPDFGGQAVFPNTQLQSSLYSICDPNRQYAGFMAFDNDLDLPAKTLLASIVYDYPFDTAIDAYGITLEPSLTILAIGSDAVPYQAVAAGMSIMGSIMIFGPADQGEVCLLEGGGTFTVSVYGEHMRNVGALQVGLSFIDSAGVPSPEFKISTAQRSTVFDGLSVSYDTALFPSVVAFSDPPNGVVGFVSWDPDVELPMQTRLLWITYQYTANAAPGIYTIIPNPEYTVVAGSLGNIPFQQSDGNVVIRAKPRLTGDVNGDCRVNVIDLVYVRNRLNEAARTDNNCMADANADGKINILDLILLRSKLGAKCP